MSKLFSYGFPIHSSCIVCAALRTSPCGYNRHKEQERHVNRLAVVARISQNENGGKCSDCVGDHVGKEVSHFVVIILHLLLGGLFLAFPQHGAHHYCKPGAFEVMEASIILWFHDRSVFSSPIIPRKVHADGEHEY